MPHSLDSFNIPNRVVLRAKSIGDVAEAWLHQLPSITETLTQLWQLSDVGQPISGGSESLVLPVKQQDGNDAIIKIGMPQVCDTGAEARILRLANGRGYACLFDVSPEHNAILVERLGKPLAESGQSAAEQIATICQTLKSAWVPLKEPNEMMTGAVKAEWLAKFIDDTWHELDKPCSLATRNQALGFCAERIAAHDRANCVLVHGDAHEQNTLATTVDGIYKFVDPDGLFAEPACDLAVPMRGLSEALLAGDVHELGMGRCHELSHLTGVDPSAIWQWGFMERVSTGLVLIQIGIKEEGQMMLNVADQWSASGTEV